MRQIVLLAFCVLAFAKAYSQTETAQDSITVTIEKPTAVDAVKTFFKHFHAKDSVALRTSMVDGLTLRSMAVSSKGKKLSKTTAAAFSKNIGSIPDSIPFEERLLEISFIGDEHLATVTTTYEFYYDNKFSHNGTNKFTLVYLDDKWLIIGLADTRLYP
jgi:hypothetical protein